jgi:hypothetical protein
MAAALPCAPDGTCGRVARRIEAGRSPSLLVTLRNLRPRASF